MALGGLNIDQIRDQTREAMQELLSAAGLKPGHIVVVGCSTSEVLGERIGSSSSLEVAGAIMQSILPPIEERKLFLAVQCCEHLNRALVVDEECAEKYGLETVCVVPYLKAGGALATVAYNSGNNKVVVEGISGHAGMDIGDTLIGMHLKRVAVPVRSIIKRIGNAHLNMARVRPKLIGGERAKYQVPPGLMKERTTEAKEK